MYHLVRRVKLIEMIDKGNSKGNSIPTNKKRTGIWRGVCGIGYMAIRFTQYLSPDHFLSECDQRVRILTLYGTALGYLNRYQEANRRFNEAHALVVSGMGLTDGKELARIHIRRAEMLLSQADNFREKLANRAKTRSHDAVYWKHAISLVDDCWASLEKGEHCLCGISHSSFWW